MWQNRCLCTAGAGAVLIIGLFLALPVYADTTASCDALQVSNAWVRLVSGAPASAGYFDLHNTGDAPVAITGVSSPQFTRAHMHESLTDKNGMASMKPVDKVAVPPGGKVSFAPGGYHLMLFKPREKIAPGDTVTLKLDCGSSGGHKIVKAQVRSTMPNGKQHMKMQHGG